MNQSYARDLESKSFQYACQIMGVRETTELPEDLIDQIYWSLRSMARIRRKEFQLETVAVICAPYVKIQAEAAEAESLKEEQARIDAKAKTAKAKKAKAAANKVAKEKAAKVPEPKIDMTFEVEEDG